MEDHSRRSFLTKTGAAVGGITLGTIPVSAAPAEERYIVDTSGLSKRRFDDVEIIYWLNEIEFAVVRGNPSAVDEKRVEPDIKLSLEDRDDAGPPVERDSKPGGPPPWGGPKDERDPLYYLQWDKQAQNVPDVHGITRGEGTRVSIIDSGIFGDHPDLDGPLNSDLSENFTQDSGDFNPVGSDHGTHVGGIVAAEDNNGIGVLGMAPDTDLVACRVFSGPFAMFGNIIAAIVYSANIDADVANLSLGAYPLPKGSEAAEVRREAYTSSSEYANEQGMMLVAAAGNDGANLDDDGDVISLPNEADNYMSISATGPIGYRWGGPGNGKGQEQRNYRAALKHLEEPTHDPAFYTNYGPEAVDISAPGGDADLEALDSVENAKYDLVLSTTFSGEDTDDDDAPDPPFEPSYGWKAGTSMASPQVAGVVALIRSLRPEMTPDEIRNHLEETATDLGSPLYHGEGHLDTGAAVRSLGTGSEGGASESSQGPDNGRGP
ncbi:S8 family serine peptidase [Halobium salinum]|uniref:S8 family serine peptidase n=1 Tax=Halobium salinum TaxID=1364940 RepID=A0ABD5PJ53_9EURY|nr:S8 family serine peptidase [Halobium salinum]